MEPKRERSNIVGGLDSETLRKRERATRRLTGSEQFRLAEIEMGRLASFPGVRWAFQTIADITKK